MNLEELKLNWAARDQKLDTIIRLNLRLLNAPKLNKTRSAMQRLMAFLVLNLAVNFIVMICLGSFIADHIAAPRFAIPAVALDAFTWLLIISSVRQLILANGIDYSGPVAEIQKKMERLRIHKIKETKWTLVVATLIWTPLLIVALKAFLGLDAYAHLGTAYLFWNVVVGVAVIALAIWVSKKYAARMESSSIMQGLMNTLAGYNLNAATQSLRNLEDFEKEERDDT
jgi:hypothetical protein